jgi:membrane fusion protein (multidrug efflux system)
MPNPRFRRAAPLSSAFVVLLALSVAACDREPEPDAGRGGDRPVPVTTQRLQMRPFSDTVQALGTVKARESVTVTAKVSETVEDVHFDSGDVVKAGAPLVTLSGQAQQASLREAQAAADEAERMFERQSELAGQQLIARSQLDTQRATRDAANARVAQIRAQLGDRVIRAPFSGVLGLRQVSPGSLVTPGTAVATLDDIARVYVDFPVPETQLAQIEAGQRLTATTAAYAGRGFEGTVSTVDARIDPATRSVTVRGDFPNPDRALMPGMLMRVTLSQSERSALLVPEISVVQVGTDSFVYRVRSDGAVERVNVEIGARREGVAEVVKGLKAGDVVVVDGTGKLRPGSKVVEAGKASAAGGDAERAP